MDFQKDFDELFNNLLIDYKNQLPEADISQGSLIYIKSACLASALWGLYKYQDYIAKQIFPDTADSENLDHHGWVRGLTRKPEESDADYLARLLDYIRRPPAGGNQYDYVKWALEITNVTAAYCYPIAQGLGTVDVVITADETATGSEVPSSHALAGTNTGVAAGALVDSTATFVASGVRVGDIAENTTLGTEATVIAVDSDTQLTVSDDIFTAIGQNYSLQSLIYQVKEYIDDVRPVAASIVRVLSPEVLTQDVTMTVEGNTLNTAQIASEITAYMTTLEPGQKLYISQLIAIAISFGADNVTVTAPAGDVTPSVYQMVRPGAINVTGV